MAAQRGVAVSYAKILLVVRSEDPEQPAVKRALELASEHTQVEVFTPVYNSHLQAYPLSDPGDYERLRDSLVQRSLEQAGALARSIERRGIRVTASAVWDYPYYEAIIRRAMAGDADLVISASLTERPQALRYADWRLLIAAPMSVLLVKSAAAQAYGAVVAAVDPLHRHDKPASLDEQILTQAKRVQALTAAKLRAVFCFVPLVHAAPVGSEALPIDIVEEQLVQESRKALEAVLARVGLHGDVGEVLSGRPEEVLPELPADLLIVGALSRGRWKDLILGSTAERILEDMKSDLLVVKPVGFQSQVSHHVSAEPVVNPVFYPF
jgi:universal stress protein E